MISHQTVMHYQCVYDTNVRFVVFDSIYIICHALWKFTPMIWLTQCMFACFCIAPTDSHPSDAVVSVTRFCQNLCKPIRMVTLLKAIFNMSWFRKHEIYLYVLSFVNSETDSTPELMTTALRMEAEHTC